MPIAFFGYKSVSLAYPNCRSGYKLSVCFCIIIITVKLIKTIGHLYSVYREVKISVLAYYFPYSMLKIGYEHSTLCIEIMHAAFDTVLIVTDPHVSILVHLAAGCIKDIVIIAYLRETFRSGIVSKVISIPVNICESITHNISVFITPILARFQSATFACCRLINITALVHIDFTPRCRVYYTIINFNCSVEYFSVLITIVKLTTIINKSAAKSGKKARCFVKMIPCNVFNVVRNSMRIAISNISVNIKPVCTFLKRYKSAEPRFTCHKIFCTIFICTESAANKLTFIIKRISKSFYFANTGIHSIVRCIKIIEIGLTAIIGNRLPSGNKNTKPCIIRIFTILKQPRQLSFASSGFAKVVPIFALFTNGITWELINSGKCLAALIIEPRTIFLHPAIFGVLFDTEGIGKVCNSIKEMRAIVIGVIFSVVIRIKTIFLLVFFLLCKRHQNMEMCINVIAKLAAHGEFDFAIIIPCRVFVRNNLYSAEYTKRVCVSWVYRFALCNKVADNCKLIVLNFCRSKGEIFVCKAKIRLVNGKALRNCRCNGNRCKRAYSLRKLKQKVPRSTSLLIAARKHVKKCRQLLRYRHFGHINRKSIIYFAGRCHISEIICIVIALICGTQHFALPRKQAAAAACIVKVEACFVVIVKICCNLSRGIERPIYCRSLRLNCSFFI